VVCVSLTAAQVYTEGELLLLPMLLLLLLLLL
jgi:hypothetical protein